jgi:hypothetical protein
VGNDPINLIDPAGLEGFNVAMDSALNGGLLSWLGFGTVAQGLMDRADGMLAMRNAATFELGLSKYRGAICQIGAGTLQAAGTMMAIAGVITTGAVLATGPGSRIAGSSAAALQKGHQFLQGFKNRKPFDQVTRQIGEFTEFAVSVPGRVAGSFTRWVKVVNQEGRTIRLYHDTFDKIGKFIHRGTKVPGRERHIQ